MGLVLFECYFAFEIKFIASFFSFTAQASKIHQETDVTLFAQNSHFFQFST